MKTKNKKTKKYDIVTLGGGVRDITFFIEQGKILKAKKGKKWIFDLGNKINLKKVYFSLGGGACNTAVGFAKLGLTTAAIIRIGKDKEGEEIKKDLIKQGVDISFIQEDEKISTGFSFICTHSQERKHIAFLYRGANNYLKIKKADLARIETDWLYTSSLSGKNWQQILEEIRKFIQEKKVKWAWNPGNKQLEKGKLLLKYFKNTEVLILNENEARFLITTITGKRPFSFSLNKLSKTIAQWGAKIIVITQGEKGASVYDSLNKKFYQSKSTGHKPLDTTGAGDAFSSGFIAGLIIYQDIKKALKLGILNSGAVIREIGAQHGLLKKEKIKL